MKKFRNKNFGSREDRRSSDRGDSGRFRGRKEFFKKDSGSRRDAERRPSRDFYNAVCDRCGKSCELPFRPTQGKPVYCSDCFRKKDSRDENRRNQGGYSDDKLNEINDKLDRIIDALDID